MSNYTIHPAGCPCPMCGGPNRQHKGPTIIYEPEPYVHRERRLNKKIVEGEVVTSETVFVDHSIEEPPFQYTHDGTEPGEVLVRLLPLAWHKYYRSLD